MGVGTRTEVKRAISKGRVSVDGACVKKPETKIDTEETTVVFDGQTVGYTKKEYYMLHKPAGVISATEDAREKTVIDLIVSRKRKDLFPVGRLDKDTEGLLLITNDGELAHRLLSPKKHVDKTYYAKVQGIVTQEDVRKFAEGVDIHEKKLTAPAVLEVVKSGEVSEILLTDILLEKMACRSVPLKRPSCAFFSRSDGFSENPSALHTSHKNFYRAEVPRYRSDDDCTDLKNAPGSIPLF